ncbi:MAG: beta-1,6-N-acetylglucosaminyltransferase [Prevotellaceae bacterium]|jgi:hypothetical protein|nr:beta-1,6-N-acetylglucosaminyltransferase [Prevotellaceae bacterium]
MKHAILITAYKDLDFIELIIKQFDNDFDFYIHIDKKCRENHDFLLHDERVHVYKRFKVFWGGLNHCKAILLLMSEAVLKSNCDYFHLITGSDFPVKPLSEFKRFFEQNAGGNFMEIFKIPRQNWGSDGGMRRLRLYWFGVDQCDMRRKFGGQFQRYSGKIQRKILHIERKFNFFDGKIWGGGTYWSLTRKAVETALNYLKENPDYLKRFYFTAIPEEILLPNILMHHPQVNITNNSLRYIDWSNPLKPKILTECDFDGIKKSDCFFARKFDKTKSKKLMDIILNNIL